MLPPHRRLVRLVTIHLLSATLKVGQTPLTSHYFTWDAVLQSIANEMQVFTSIS